MESWGSKAKIISPPSMVQQMKEEMGKMNN
jgi:hypothetical protein